MKRLHYLKLAKGEKLVVGLDFDNTLVKCRTSVIKVAAKNLGLLTYPKKHDYLFSKFPENLRNEIFRLFDEPQYMLDLKIYPGAVKKLEEWKAKGHKLVIITARNKTLHEGTKEFIREHFPMVDDLVFVGLGKSKENVFKDQEIDVWIDDSPTETVRAVQMGIVTFLICNNETLYNAEVRGKHAIYMPTKVSDINLLL